MAKTSLKERLKEKQKELRSRGSSGNILFLKDGDKVRVRLLPMGDDEDFIKEVTQFYLGSEIKGVISPTTFDEPCAIFDKFKELSQGDEEDKKLAKEFNIRKRYLAYGVVYKDLKGKEIDDRSPRFILITNSMYQDIIEYYLDEDDWGDMSDPSKNGYDLKLGRTGSGKTDTAYTVTTCPKSSCPSPYGDKDYNLDELVKEIIPTYEETEELLSKFLGDDVERNFEEAKARPKSRRRSSESASDKSERSSRRRRRSRDV